MLYWVEFYFMPRTKAKIKYNSGGSRRRAPGVAPSLHYIILGKKIRRENGNAGKASKKPGSGGAPLFWVKKTQKEENPEGQTKQNWAPLAQRLEPITWSLKVKRKCGEREVFFTSLLYIFLYIISFYNCLN